VRQGSNDLRIRQQHLSRTYATLAKRQIEVNVAAVLGEGSRIDAAGEVEDAGKLLADLSQGLDLDNSHGTL
jgi:hypothetical protein